jgi:hypothetical protein
VPAVSVYHDSDKIGSVALASIEVCPLARRPQRLLEARRMIVIGVDVHKQSVTAVAVDEPGPDARRETSNPRSSSTTRPESSNGARANYGNRTGTRRRGRRAPPPLRPRCRPC